MLYEIQPEHDLADLSENEMYEQVAQLTAERQLVQELGILDDDAVLNAAVTDLEVYCIDVERQNQSVPLGRV
jgi:thiamine monophosphate kinase